MSASGRERRAGTPVGTPAVRAIVVCPLRFEAQALQRSALGNHLHIECCGPGAHAIDHWCERLGQSDVPIVLAGLVGGLDPNMGRGSAWWIDRVILNAGGDSMRMNLQGASGSPRATITAAPHSITTPHAKAALFHQTAAQLVDLESISFAVAAQRLGWRAGIVRGVSDDAAGSLPSGIDSWVDAHGSTRPLAVGAALLRRPGLVLRMPGLARDSRAAMRSVAALLGSWLASTE